MYKLKYNCLMYICRAIYQAASSFVVCTVHIFQYTTVQYNVRSIRTCVSISSIKYVVYAFRGLMCGSFTLYKIQCMRYDYSAVMEYIHSHSNCGYVLLYCGTAICEQNLVSGLISSGKCLSSQFQCLSKQGIR